MALFENMYNSNAWFGKERMQMPGAATFGNAFSNLKPGFMFGLTGNPAHMDPRKGGFRGTPFNFKKFGDKIKDTKHAGKTAWNPQLSLGGVMTAGYGAVGGALGGAALGATAGVLIEGSNPAAMAAGGAIIGGAAMVAAPIVAGAAVRGAGAALAATPKAFAAVGDGMIKGAGLLGKAANTFLNGTAMSLGSSLGDIAKFGGAKGIIGTVANPVSRGIGTVGAISKLMIKEAPNSYGILAKNYKFSGFGLSMMATGSLVSGAKKAYGTFMDEMTGQRDPYISTSTPQIRFTDNAGATGDLVFALNNTRRG